MTEIEVRKQMKFAVTMVDELLPNISEYYRMIFISQVFEKVSSMTISKKRKHKKIGFSIDSLKETL